MLIDKRKTTHLFLFIVSFVYMSLEMLAFRLIPPYFGNSTYTWGAIICVFLIGSSIGYLFG